MTDLLAYWEKALQSEVGYAIETEDTRRLAADLYEARKGYPEFAKIRLCHPAGGREIWLVKEET